MKKIPTVENLIFLFNRINEDCKKSGESVVDLTDEYYYSEQIANIYDLDEVESEKLAKKMAEKVAKGTK